MANILTTADPSAITTGACAEADNITAPTNLANLLSVGNSDNAPGSGDEGSTASYSSGVPSLFPETGRDVKQEFLRNLVKCFRCKETCSTVPVYQCRASHLICSSCVGQRQLGWDIADCKACKKAITDGKRERNMVAEEIMLELDVYCTSRDEGCDMTMKQRELEAHLQDCPSALHGFCDEMYRLEPRIRKVFALSEACEPFFNEDNSGFMEHLEEIHQLKGSTTGKLKFDMTPMLKSISFGTLERFAGKAPSVWLRYMYFDQRMFIVKLKLARSILQSEISCKVLFLGSESAAKKYRVRIEAIFQPLSLVGPKTSENKEKRRKIQHKDSVVSFYADWKGNPNHKFELPWATVEEQKKQAEPEELDWKIKLKILKRSPAAEVAEAEAPGIVDIEPGDAPPSYQQVEAEQLLSTF